MRKNHDSKGGIYRESGKVETGYPLAPQVFGGRVGGNGTGFVIFPVVVFLIFMLTAAPHAQAITLAIFEYPPLLGKDIKEFGLEAAIVTAAFKESGTKVDYEILPPARAFKFSSRGKFDGTLGWVRSEAREKQFFYSEPIYESTLVLFHLKSYQFDWQTYDDLREIPMGITAYNYYGKAFHVYLDAGEFKTDTAHRDEHQFNKILRNRIRLLPMNIDTGYYTVRKKYNKKTAGRFTHHPRMLKRSVYHVLLPKSLEESQDRIRMFNRGLRMIKQSGKYNRIIEAFRKEYKLRGNFAGNGRGSE